MSESQSNETKSSLITNLLFKPYAVFTGRQALGVGLLLIVASSILNFFTGTHFDGVLDAHFGAKGPFSVFLLEGIINWVVVAVVFSLASKIFGSISFRLSELWGYMALSRTPFVLISLASFIQPFRRYTSYMLWKYNGFGEEVVLGRFDLLFFIIGTLLSVYAIIHMIYLTAGFVSNTSGMKSWRLRIIMIAGFFAAEIITKMIFIRMYSSMDQLTG